MENIDGGPSCKDREDRGEITRGREIHDAEMEFRRRESGEARRECMKAKTR